eukprot:1350022-Amorphochlora_amoeboformis.AAC.1
MQDIHILISAACVKHPFLLGSPPQQTSSGGYILAIYYRKGQIITPQMSGMSSPLQLSQLPSHATSRISVGSFSARRRSTLFLIAAAGTLACVYAIQIDFNGLNGSPVRSPGFRSRVQSGIAGLGGVWTPRFARPERCTTPRLMRVSAEVDKIRFEVNKLRARQIKAELTELGIDTSTVVEKEE